MLFNSIEFAFFFLIVTVLYFMLPHRFRWLLLLIASCIFYMAFVPAYILILFATIIIDYFAGIWIASASSDAQRKRFLILSIIANVGVLAVFKYCNFFVDNVNDLLRLVHIDVKPIPYWDIVLPIGLSFHTFQAMSYTIEVYRKKQEPERHFGIYALYVMYYPQLVAGPIERPQNILHQLKEEHHFDYDRVTEGLKLMAWGLFKKVVIADNLAHIVNIGYTDVGSLHNVSALVVMVFFSIQIYCDFSGYSDMAIGSSRVMGIDLMRNFRQPYFSKSLGEFWGRWHISLSTWFKDYVYIPLGGNRVALWKHYRNLLIVFLLSGFWHGASWTFVFWGLIHGVYLILESFLRSRFKARLNPFVSGLVTFGIVTIAWVFFRAESFGQATTLLGNVLTPTSLSTIKQELNRFQIGYLTAVQILVSLCVLIYVDMVDSKHGLLQWVGERQKLVRWSFYYLAVAAILFWGFWGEEQFIYFQF